MTQKIFTLLFLSSFFYASLKSQCFRQVETGQSHTLAIKTDGTLWTWGFNALGQLGNGTTLNDSIPRQVGVDNNWKSMAGGHNHSLAIKKDGTLWAWGHNHAGQLGNGTNTNQLTPIQVGLSTDWKYVSTRGLYSLAMKENGTIWSWGDNYNGELGNGTLIDQNTPQQIGDDDDWIEISGGIHHSVLIKADGSLWAFGDNYHSQLGDGTNIDRTSPIQIGTDMNWEKVSAGYRHTTALKTDGTLWAWGHNSDGELGDGTFIQRTTPTQIGTDMDWTSVRSAQGNTIAKKADGTAWVWGRNDYGQMGNGTAAINDYIPYPVPLGTDNDWEQISGGIFFFVGIKNDHTLWTGGDNRWGQLGDSTTVDKSILTQVICEDTNVSVTASPLSKISAKIFPNPFSTFPITLQLDTQSSSRWQIMLSDVAGKVITAKEIFLNNTNQSTSLDFQGLNKGVYFLSIDNGRERYIEKIIFQ